MFSMVRVDGVIDLGGLGWGGRGSDLVIPLFIAS